MKKGTVILRIFQGICVLVGGWYVLVAIMLGPGHVEVPQMLLYGILILCSLLFEFLRNKISKDYVFYIVLAFYFFVLAIPHLDDPDVYPYCGLITVLLSLGSLLCILLTQLCKLLSKLRKKYYSSITYREMCYRRIERIRTHYKNGIITEDEFNNMKDDILKRIDS